MTRTGAAPGSLRVLVVDDSAVVRETLRQLLSQEPGFEVETAADPLLALPKMERSPPDVLVLDLEMPRMDGLTFLRKVMAERPLPVVICSGHTGHGSEAALRALREGAVEVIAKPRIGVREFLNESAVQLVDALRGAARARVRRPIRPARPWSAAATAASPAPRLALVGVGASTGGTEALRFLLGALPDDAPPMVVVQHMPEGFTDAFARHLDQDCRMRVREARDGDACEQGLVLIAPGNRHLTVERRQAGFRARVSDGPLVSRHRPSVDVLFHSLARAAGAEALALLLTGMGSDGADGMVALKRSGATTLAQDEASCVVFGMPKEAIARGAVDRVLPLAACPAAILHRGLRGPGLGAARP